MTSDPIEVHWVASPAEFVGVIALRERVFCDEQGVSREEELDGLDKEARHIVAIERREGNVIGTTRLLVAGDTAKVGRVAVAREWRRRGVGARMLELALAGARESGCVSARLAAQVQATALYEQAGFAVESERFEEAGIAHVWMGRSIAPAA